MIERSSCWPFSSSAISVRPTAVAVPLSVWTNSGRPVGPDTDVEPARLESVVLEHEVSSR